MNPPAELLDITDFIPDVKLDIRYATTNNFTGEQLYKNPVAWLRSEPLKALSQAADKLRFIGCRLVIFDAYRPPSVQEKLRTVCDNDDYVMEVSNHCRGITVDVTLVGADGKYLDMGTDYDDFSEKAHIDASGITLEQQANRRLLQEVMEMQGFVQHSFEWWHYDYRPDNNWSLIQDEQNSYTVAKVL